MSVVPDAAETALKRAEWQQTLFAPRPSRIDLLGLSPSWKCRPVKVRVHRNQTFENIASVAGAYLAYGGLQVNFTYSDYDDSLSFSLSDKVDIELIWLDFERFSNSSAPAGLVEWLKGRLTYLRGASGAAILVGNREGLDTDVDEFNAALEDAVRDMPGVRICDRQAISCMMGPLYFSDRTAKLSGTRISDPARVLLARELGCRWIPAAVSPRLKAIAIDLDNTLYKGVLGEDGAEGVQLTPGHEALQKFLVEIHTQGIFLAIVSRNEPADVENMFKAREDFPLSWDHFSARAISWSDKSDGIVAVAGNLRIGIDSIVFVDDNPGEIASVAMRHPQLKTVLAGDDASATERALKWQPGLWVWATGEEDALRAADLSAGKEREALITASAGPMDYLRSLQVSLTFSVDSLVQANRLHELSQKTNQFNLNFRRMSEQELVDYMRSDARRVVGIRLKDRLSDSGVIGLISGALEGEKLVIDELCISCRALGRALEDIMITGGIRLMIGERRVETVEFMAAPGERNGPALAWLSQFTGGTVSPPCAVAVPADFFRRPVSECVEIKVEET